MWDIKAWLYNDGIPKSRDSLYLCDHVQAGV